jgi:hypothetical protein
MKNSDCNKCGEPNEFQLSGLCLDCYADDIKLDEESENPGNGEDGESPYARKLSDGFAMMEADNYERPNTYNLLWS